MFCIRANKPGSVCARSSRDPRWRVARRAGGLPLDNALSGLSAFLRCKMVAPAVFRLGYVPKPCLARPMLFAALACLDAGDMIGAGVRLREATKRFLIAAVDWYGCEVKKTKHPRPADYAKALRDAKQLGPMGFEILMECIDTGNKLAHCQSVDRYAVSGGISLLFSMMDDQPYCCHERTPVATSYKDEQSYDCDCDDSDSADWWKGGSNED